MTAPRRSVERHFAAGAALALGLLLATPAPAQTPPQPSPALSLRLSDPPRSPAATDSPTQPAAAIKTESTQFESWVVACEIRGASPETRRCLARTSVVNGSGPEPNNRKTVLIVMIGKNDAGAWSVFVRTPPSVVIRPGVRLALDGKRERKLDLINCDPVSCLAEAPLDAAYREEWLAAESAVVGWTTLRNGDARVEFKLKGAQAAISLLFKP